VPCLFVLRALFLSLLISRFVCASGFSHVMLIVFPVVCLAAWRPNRHCFSKRCQLVPRLRKKKKRRQEQQDSMLQKNREAKRRNSDEHVERGIDEHFPDFTRHDRTEILVDGVNLEDFVKAALPCQEVEWPHWVTLLVCCAKAIHQGRQCSRTRPTHCSEQRTVTRG